MGPCDIKKSSGAGDGLSASLPLCFIPLLPRCYHCSVRDVEFLRKRSPKRPAEGCLAVRCREQPGLGFAAL